MTRPLLHSVPLKTEPKPLIRLIVDNNTGIQIGDKPVFGAEVTISENLRNLQGQVALPGVVIGWVNYVNESKFACLTTDNHYVEAAKYLRMCQNQIVLSKAIKIVSIEDDMKQTKQILTFSESS